MAAWVAPAIMAGGSILSALASGMGGGDDDKGAVGGKPLKPKILERTDSQRSAEEQEILYDAASLDAMSELADSIGEFAEMNESFLRDTYMPLQQQMTQANTQMIPQMESIVGDSLESMSRDLVSNRVLGDILSQRVKGDADPNSFINRTMKAFESEMENLPTEDERVGQALASVEHQFKGAGKQLAADFASRGQSVSQASARDLAMKKATAKAGAAGLAKESSRAERTSMLEKGVSFGLEKRALEEQVTQGATAGLLGLQQLQTGAMGAKEGLFDVDAADPTTSRGQQADLVGRAGTLQRGTKGTGDTTSHVQRGLAKGPEVDPETGALVIDRRKRHMMESGEEIWESEKDQLRQIKEEKGLKGTMHSTTSIADKELYDKSGSNKEIKRQFQERAFAHRADTRSTMQDPDFQGDPTRRFGSQEEYDRFIAERTTDETGNKMIGGLDFDKTRKFKDLKRMKQGLKDMGVKYKDGEFKDTGSGERWTEGGGGEATDAPGAPRSMTGAERESAFGFMDRSLTGGLVGAITGYGSGSGSGGGSAAAGGYGDPDGAGGGRGSVGGGAGHDSGSY